MIIPSVLTRDAWLHDTGSQAMYVTVYATSGAYFWPFGSAHLFAQTSEFIDGTWTGWVDMPSEWISFPGFKEKTYLYVASKKDVWVRLRGAVKYKGSLATTWKYKYGASISVYVPPAATDPYVSTGAAYGVDDTTIVVYAHGFPAANNNNELWVQYKELDAPDWIDTSKDAVANGELKSISKSITVTTSVVYEVRAALSYNDGATTIYGEIVTVSTDTEQLDDLECETKPAGAGTEANPYIITDICKLNWIGGDSVEDPKVDRLKAWYELGNNIDASSTRQFRWQSAAGYFAGFRPIGTHTTDPFIGNFDGKLFWISNLYINHRPAGNAYAGLFARLNNASVKRVLFESPHITGIGIAAADGHAYAAPLAAYVTGTTVVEYCGVIGGSVYAEGEDTTKTPHTHTGAGGLVAFIYGGTVITRYCYTNISVSAKVYQEGIAIAGGIAATLWGTSSHLYDCFARGSVHVTKGRYPVREAGGLVGFTNTYISRCYSTGAVTDADDSTYTYIGGLVGFHTGTPANDVKDSFWDLETSGQDKSQGGTGKTTAEMKNILTFTDIATEGLTNPWDFVTIWAIDSNINDGYPYLQWALYGLILLTHAATDIGGISFNSNGEIVYALPNAYIRGFAYIKASTGDPDVGDDVVYEEGDYGASLFSLLISQLDPGGTYRVRSFAMNYGVGLAWGNTITVVLEHAELYPTDSMARASSVRRIYKPGLYRMECAIGDLGFDVDVAELGVRKIVGEVEEPEHPDEEHIPEKKEPAPIDWDEVARLARLYAEEFGDFEMPEYPTVSGKYTAPMPLPKSEDISTVPIWDRPILELIGLDKIYGAISSVFKGLFKLFGKEW